LLLAGLIVTVGTYLFAPGGRFVIAIGLIFVGAGILGRGLQALFFRN
jgi:hypothetical protein